MGFFDDLKAFVHSITTDDHYASFDSPYKNSTVSGGATNSNSRLHELGRLATNNSSTQSFTESRNSSSSNIQGAGAGAVGYRPGLRSSTTNLNGSDLQLQNLNQAGQPPLPLIDSLWHRIETWVDEEYPELGDNLNYGVTTADLNEFENDIGCGALPTEFRQFYKIHDGQMRGGQPSGLILGLNLLDIEGIAEEYKIWGKVAMRLEKQQYLMQHQHQQTSASSSSKAAQTGNNNFLGNQKCLPPQTIQCVYSHKGWIPFVKDDGGNQIAIDLAPGPLGQWGQIIIFGRDFDTKVVVASSFQEFIFNYVTDLEVGNFQIDQNENDESLGYLEISRDDDYMIGAEEENQGELNFFDRSGKEFGKLKEKLSYIEVLKRRALKNFGINNVDQFSTAFVPQRIKKTQAQRVPEDFRSSTPLNVPRASSPLINIESSSKIALTKETLIDDDEVKKDEVKEVDVPVVPKEEVKTAHKEEHKEEPREEPKEELKEEEPKVTNEDSEKKPLSKNQAKKAKKQAKAAAEAEEKEEASKEEPEPKKDDTLEQASDITEATDGMKDVAL